MIARLAKWIVVGVVLVGVASGQGSNPKRPMTFADLMAMKRVSDPQISPSGKWVLFSVTEVSLEKNSKLNHLWVVPITGDSGVPAADVGPYDIGRTTGARPVTSWDGETNGRFSPDGRWVSLTMKDQVYRVAWNEEQGRIGAGDYANYVQVTNVAGGADGAIWSPDSKRLMFTAEVYPECSNKPTWPEENACDKAKDDAAAKDPVKAQVWDALLYRHWDHYTGEKRSHVLVVDLDGKNMRDLTPASVVGDAETPTFSLSGPLGYAWAPDSKEIAYVTNLDKVPAASTNNDVFTLRVDELGAKAVKVSTSPGSDDGPAYSPDGKWLAFRSQARAGYESDRFRLMLFDREKKTIKELLPKWDDWVDEFVWSPDSERVYFASGHGGEAPVYEADVSGADEGHATSGTGQAATGQAAEIVQFGEFGDLRVSPDGSLLAMVGMRVDMPATIVSTLLDIPDGRIAMLTHVNDSVMNQVELMPMESFNFSGAEGTKVQGFILRPPNFDPAKKYPLKFLIHGGPQGAWGDSWSYRWNAELMAARGYVVVMVNPRGSTGYGQKFVEGVSGDWGGKPYVDLMRGLDAAEAKFPFIDKTRECALGASYGGYMADWILTHTDRFKCIVTHDGMVDAVAAYGSTEEMWFNEWEFRRGPETGAAAWDAQPATPWRYQNLPADQDPFRKWSPIRYIQNAKTPTLVIHSQKDYRLDVSQGFELFTALQRLNVPSKFLYFPDEGHWVLKPKNSELWYQTVGDWCDRWTHTGIYAAQ